jgi:RHS repeat-associated protein
VELDGRTVSGGYRYGFNGKEKTDEISGEGNSYDFGARMLDPKIGRWLSIDPMARKQPEQSPFKAFLNCPLVYIDPNGMDEFERIIIYNKKGQIIAQADKLIKEGYYMSSGIIYFYDTKVPELSNGYNYFSKTKKITVNDAGVITNVVYDTRNIIKWEDGIQDREFGLGSEYKGTIYDDGESSYEGKGGYQNGGWNLTSERGGASPTKTKSKYFAESKDIGLLLDVLSNIGGAKIGSKIPDKIKDLAGIVSKTIEVSNENFYTYQEYNYKETNRKGEYIGYPVYPSDKIPKYKSLNELKKAHPKAIKDKSFGESEDNRHYKTINYPSN